MNKLVDVNQAIELFKQGKIGIFPTDTAFGIGCILSSERSVKRVFEIKRRPENKPTPILVNSKEMVKRVAQTEIYSKVEKLMDTYWPGGLTIILSSHNPEIPRLVTAGTQTVGVRMPNHVGVLHILNGLDEPILAPSANFSGESTPFESSDIDPALLNLVDFIVQGECITKIASTVIDCTKDPFAIVRDGAVTVDTILI